MARETKLGLLIGGTFIFCFALILSHSSQEPGISEQLSSLLTSSPSLGADLSEQASRGRLPRTAVHSAGAEIGRWQTPLTRSQQPDPRPTQAAIQPGGGATEQSHSSLGHEVIARLDSGSPTSMRQSPTPSNPPPQTAVTDAIANRPLKIPQKNLLADSHSGFPTANPYAPVGGRVTAPRPAVSSQPAPPAGAQPRRVQVYVVAKNDNLTRIAKKFYGRPTSEHIERIFRANRDTLRSKDSLRVGQKLEIPILPSTEPARNVRTRTNRRGATDARLASGQGTGGGWRWYQIRPDDLYSKIAREQLGDHRRWKELYELNRDRFPDPNRIRPGVRIKIPE